MSTDTIKAKYDFGFDEGKNELIRTSFKYGVYGLLIGAFIRFGIYMYKGSSAATVSKV